MIDNYIMYVLSAQQNVQYNLLCSLQNANTRCEYLIISLEQAQCGNYNTHTIVRCTDTHNVYT